MKFLQVLALAALLALAGCSSGSRYSKEQIEGTIHTEFEERLAKEGKGVKVVEVAMVQESNTVWRGYVKLSDGSDIKATTTIDQNTGEDITTFD